MRIEFAADVAVPATPGDVSCLVGNERAGDRRAAHTIPVSLLRLYRPEDRSRHGPSSRACTSRHAGFAFTERIGFVDYAQHIRRTVESNWLEALGTVGALSLVIAIAVICSRKSAASGPVARSRASGRTVGRPDPGSSGDSGDDRHSAAFSARVRWLVQAIEENVEAKVAEAVLRLSRSRRVFAPLAFTISAFVMLYDGLKLLVSNWRLTLVQIDPTMWIWLAMFDLKAHALHGQSFNVLRGPS